MPSRKHVGGFGPYRRKRAVGASAGSPDTTHLTVLVLDCFELQSGSQRVTFLGPSRTGAASSSAVSGVPRRFDVAISFPGELRSKVQAVDDNLTKTLSRSKVFYDDRFKAELARPNLDTYLQSIYAEQSRLIVVFVCQDYENKQWCGLEWRAIRELIKQRQDDSILLVRADDAKVSGVFSIDGYIDLHKHSPEQVSDLILERLSLLRP